VAPARTRCGPKVLALVDDWWRSGDREPTFEKEGTMDCCSSGAAGGAAAAVCCCGWAFTLPVCTQQVNEASKWRVSQRCQKVVRQCIASASRTDSLDVAGTDAAAFLMGPLDSPVPSFMSTASAEAPLSAAPPDDGDCSVSRPVGALACAVTELLLSSDIVLTRSVRAPAPPFAAIASGTVHTMHARGQ
jgi:hypothetical protein